MMRTVVLAIFIVGYIALVLIFITEYRYIERIFGTEFIPINISYIKTQTSKITSEFLKVDDAFVNKSREPFVVDNISLAIDVMLKRITKYKMNDTCVTTPFVICKDSTFRKRTSKKEKFGIALLRPVAWLPVGEFFNFSKCQYTNCYFQNDTITESTRMVIVDIARMPGDFPPVERWPHQLYVASIWESPNHIFRSFLNNRNSTWNKAFNLTATYRTDSDLFVPYGKLQFHPKPVRERPKYYEIAKKKTKWALWFVSYCNAPSKRDDYVEQMQNIISVDVFGQCGRNCTEDSAFCIGSNFSDYRFYLSFENSLCLDYLTEKYFKFFNPNISIIPVVRGAFQYNKYLPQNTFINSADFSSATHLALYLKRLGEDHLAYSRYLRQKDMYRLPERYGLFNLGCEACRFLNRKKLKKQINNLNHWMVDEKCFSPKDL